MKGLQVLEEMYLVRLKLELFSQQSESKQGNMQELRVVDQGYRAGIFKKSMRARHRGGIGFSYRPARLHRLAEFIPWNQCRGPINI
jgi:hypothetical protein